MLGIRKPLVAHCVDRVPFVVEVVPDNVLEMLGRFTELSHHGVFDCCHSYHFIILERMVRGNRADSGLCTRGKGEKKKVPGGSSGHPVEFQSETHIQAR